MLSSDEGLFANRAARIIAMAISPPPWGKPAAEEGDLHRMVLAQIEHFLSICQVDWGVSPVNIESIDIHVRFCMGYFHCGQWNAATASIQDIADFCRACFGNMHHTTKHAIQILVAAHFKLAGDPDDGGPSLGSAIDRWKSDQNPYFPDLLREVGRLGKKRRIEGRFNEARIILARAVEEFGTLASEDSDRDLCWAKDQLASTLQAFMTPEDLSRAYSLHREATAGLGKEHDLVLDIKENACWALLWLDSSKAMDATDIMMDVLLDRVGRVGKRHRSSLLSMLSVSIFSFASGFVAEARDLIRGVRRIENDDPRILTPAEIGLSRATRWSLLGRCDEAESILTAEELDAISAGFANKNISPGLVLGVATVVALSLATWPSPHAPTGLCEILDRHIITCLVRSSEDRHLLAHEMQKTHEYISSAVEQGETVLGALGQAGHDLDLRLLRPFITTYRDTPGRSETKERLRAIVMSLCSEIPMAFDDTTIMTSAADGNLAPYAESTTSYADSGVTFPTNPQYAESVFSAVMTEISMSSNSSMDYVVAARGEVVQLLLAEEEIQTLVKSALLDPRIGPRRLARNLRRLLVEFSKDLLTQATSLAHKEAAKLIRTQSLQIANMVNSSSDPTSIEDDGPGLWAQLNNDGHAEGRNQVLVKYLKDLPDHTPDTRGWGPVGQSLEDDVEKDGEALSDGSSDEETDLDENPTSKNDGKLSTGDLEEVKDFIRSGLPLVKFKERLRKFVSPNVGQEGPEAGKVEGPDIPEDLIGEGVVADLGEGTTAPQGTFDHTVDDPITPARMMPTAVAPEVAFQEDIGSVTMDKDIGFDENRKGMVTLSPDERAMDGLEPDPEENIQSDLLPAKPNPPTHPATFPELLDFVVEKITGPGTEPPVPTGHSRIRWTCVSAIDY